jgi:hypothetical protein
MFVHQFRSLRSQLIQKAQAEYTDEDTIALVERLQGFGRSLEPWLWLPSGSASAGHDAEVFAAAACGYGV